MADKKIDPMDFSSLPEDAIKKKMEEIKSRDREEDMKTFLRECKAHPEKIACWHFSESLEELCKRFGV